MTITFPDASEIDTDTANLVVDQSDTGVYFESKDWRQLPYDEIGDEGTASSDDSLLPFEAMVRKYLMSPAHERARIREQVIEELGTRVRVVDRIRTLLSLAVQSPQPGRLDSAIDVLRDNRVDLLTYISQSPSCFEFDDDDALYILIRTAGKRKDVTTSALVVWGLKHNQPSIREAVVEALTDIGTEGAIAYLEEIARDDVSYAVRRAAQESLAELKEA